MPSAYRPALSVVITNHNYGRYLAAAVESALAQDEGTEVIVVDDGSTDDSLDVIASLDEHRVRSILQDNDGQASAINTGFAASTGGLVIFLDADDLLEPHVLASLNEAFGAGAVHVHWQLRLADARGRPSGGLRPAAPGSTGDLRRVISLHGPGVLQVTPTSGNAFARQFLETALPMPTSAFRTGGCDLYLSWLAAASGRVENISRPLSRYRRHGSNDNISGSTDARIDRGLGWARQGFVAVADRLGLERDATHRWGDHEWWHQIEVARTVVREHVPADARMLIVDDYLWAVRDTFAERNAVQLAADGAGDADTALVRQMSSALATGISHLLVATFCDWWFELFPKWRDWVLGNATDVHVGPAATVYCFRTHS